MKFSIIIPSYNQGRFIRATLDSIFAQNWSSLQVIVIDGGSTDSTRSVVESYGKKIDIWISEPDRGQTHAINKGLALVDGEIVGWLNSDDIYLPGAFHAVAAAFSDVSQPDVVHGDRLLLTIDGGVCGWSCTTAFRPDLYGYNMNSETAFWRTKRSIAGPERLKEELQFAMDLEWFLSLFQAGARFKKIDRFLGGFRCHEFNKSSTMHSVGEFESIREWQRILGNGTKSIYPPYRRLAHFFAPFRHPILLGFPYLIQRIASRKPRK